MSTAIVHALNERDALKKEIERLKERDLEITGEVNILSMSTEVLKKLSDLATTASVQQINTIVTQGLKDIFFDQDIEFQSEYVVKHGTPGLRFSFKVDGHERPADDESVGGGVLGVTSTLLSILQHKLFNLAPILLLDETLVHVSAQYLPNAAQFLRELAEKLELTIIMVSHQQELSSAAHTVVRANSTPNGLNICIEGDPQ